MGIWHRIGGGERVGHDVWPAEPAATPITTSAVFVGVDARWAR